MRYSNVILTDDNFDDELELLCDKMNMPLECYHEFKDCLDDSFELQHNDDIEEWISSNKCSADFSSDCSFIIQKYKLAYQFGNGFMIFDYNNVI